MTKNLSTIYNSHIWGSSLVTRWTAETDARQVICESKLIYLIQFAKHIYPCILLWCLAEEASMPYSYLCNQSLWNSCNLAHLAQLHLCNGLKTTHWRIPHLCSEIYLALDLKVRSSSHKVLVGHGNRHWSQIWLSQNPPWGLRLTEVSNGTTDR